MRRLRLNRDPCYPAGQLLQHPSQAIFNGYLRAAARRRPPAAAAAAIARDDHSLCHAIKHVRYLSLSLYMLYHYYRSLS